MGAGGSKTPEELEAEYAMKISLRPWKRLKEYRDYSDYSLQISLGHWAKVGDLIRVKQLLAEVKKRTQKFVETALEQEGNRVSDEEKRSLTPLEVTELTPKITRVFLENMCRLAFQGAIQASQIEVLDMFLESGLGVLPLEYNNFVQHPIHFCRRSEEIEYLIAHGLNIYESEAGFHGSEFQKALIFHAGNGLGHQRVLQHLLKRSAPVSSETAAILLNRSVELITKTQYTIYLERLVYFGIDMKVQLDIPLSKLDKDSLAREFIKVYLDLLELEEPETSYDAAMRTKQYRKQYPVVRRLFASGFLRSSQLRAHVETYMQVARGESELPIEASPVELVIRAAMIGHKRVSMEMNELREEILLLCLDLEHDVMVECHICCYKQHISFIRSESEDEKQEIAQSKRFSEAIARALTYRDAVALVESEGVESLHEVDRPLALENRVSHETLAEELHYPIPLDIANCIVEMVYGYC
jgi:hypothetical protein